MKIFFKLFIITFSLFIIHFSLFTVHCYSQQIENVNFKVDNNILVVTYDLVNCPGGKLYDVNLKIISDSGIYVPKSVSGDLENVRPGTNKKIQWNISNDNTKIKNNIQAIVEITNIHSQSSIKITGGPANALLSVLLPGLGDVFVGKEHNVVPYAIMLAYAGSVFFAIHNYNNYQSFVPNELSPTGYYSPLYYSKDLITGVHCSLFIIHYSLFIAHVAVKGTKNKKQQLASANNNGKLKLYFAATPNNYQTCLVKHC